MIGSEEGRLTPCPGPRLQPFSGEHEWVAPVTREPDSYLHLTEPVDMDSVELLRIGRGQLIARMVICRWCGIQPEGGDDGTSQDR